MKDDELVALTGAKKLEALNLNGTPITSRGVARLSSLTGLKYLNLCVSALRDADLAVIKNLPRLYALEISYTPIGDAGLKHLAECASLRTLYLIDTKVTDGGVAMLKAALPRCEVVRKAPADTADSDRELAAWLLQKDVPVAITAGDLPRTWEQYWANPWISRPQDLPKGPFKLVSIGLRPYQQVGPEVIRRFGEAKNLVHLWLFGCSTFDDASLAALSNCREMVWLNAEVTKVTDAGLKHLRG